MKNESEKEIINLKKDISLNGVLARLIGEYVASIFSKDASVTPLTELFPELFQEEKRDIGKREMELYKAKMQDFAERHNERLKQKGGSK